MPLKPQTHRAEPDYPTRKHRASLKTMLKQAAAIVGTGAALFATGCRTAGDVHPVYPPGEPPMPTAVDDPDESDDSQTQDQQPQGDQQEPLRPPGMPPAPAPDQDQPCPGDETPET